MRRITISSFPQSATMGYKLSSLTTPGSSADALFVLNGTVSAVAAGAGGTPVEPSAWRSCLRGATARIGESDLVYYTPATSTGTAAAANSGGSILRPSAGMGAGGGAALTEQSISGPEVAVFATVRPIASNGKGGKDGKDGKGGKDGKDGKDGESPSGIIEEGVLAVTVRPVESDGPVPQWDGSERTLATQGCARVCRGTVCSLLLYLTLSLSLWSLTSLSLTLFLVFTTHSRLHSRLHTHTHTYRPGNIL